MPITSSTIAEDRAQSDGRRSIRELHVDHLGVQHVRSYLAAAGQDVAAQLAARAAEIEASSTAQEIAANADAVQDEESPTLRFSYSTTNQLATEIRERFRTATGPQLARIAARLLTLTDAQLRTLFNMTQAQVTSLKTRLQAKVTKWAVLKNEAGE